MSNLLHGLGLVLDLHFVCSANSNELIQYKASRSGPLQYITLFWYWPVMMIDHNTSLDHIFDHNDFSECQHICLLRIMCFLYICCLICLVFTVFPLLQLLAIFCQTVTRHHPSLQRLRSPLTATTILYGRLLTIWHHGTMKPLHRRHRLNGWVPVDGWRYGCLVVAWPKVHLTNNQILCFICWSPQC